MQNNHSGMTWTSPECDFEELRNNGKYAEMVDTATQNANQIISLCRHHANEDLRKSIRYGITMLSYFERSLQQDEEIKAIFAVGKLMGHIEALEKLQFASDQERMAYERAKLTGTKHLDEIILALETHGPMSQTELCDLLDLRASTLSEALKKIRKTQLIQASPYGKYKVFSLTESGKTFALSLRIKSRNVLEMDATIERLCQYLTAPESKSACLRAMKNKLPRDAGILVTAGDQILIYECDAKVAAKLNVDITLQYTTNQADNNLAVLAGTVNEFNAEIVNCRSGGMQVARKECV